MQYCDSTDAILKWSSEEVIVPYLSPLDGKTHRYFVDFWIKTVTEETKEECMLIEIKPKSMTKQPITEGKPMTKGRYNQMRDWIINSTKWDAARAFCESRGWKFKILTEVDIFGKTGKMGR